VTLIVGILCEGGVVVAADKQMTQGAMGMRTIGQAGTKVDLFRDTNDKLSDALFAATGPASLAQQLSSLIEHNHQPLSAMPYHQAVPQLQSAFRQVIAPAMQMAQQAARLVPTAAHDALCGAVLAMQFQDGVKLIEVSYQGACEFIRPESPFVCLGSGKQNADPIIGYLRSVYWPDRLPTLRQGVLTGLWTVKVASDLRTDAVGMGCDVFTLAPAQAVGGELRHVAAHLKDPDLAEHYDFMKAVHEAMKSIPHNMSPAQQQAGDKDLPKAPQ
jgi:20S proteasome alpha/beta subunit